MVNGTIANLRNHEMVYCESSVSKSRDNSIVHFQLHKTETIQLSLQEFGHLNDVKKVVNAVADYSNCRR